MRSYFIAMKWSSEKCLRLVHQIHRIFGLSYIVDGCLLSVEFMYTLLVFLVYLYCFSQAELSITSQNHIYFKIQNMLFFISIHGFIFAPLIILLRFRLMNKDLIALVDIARRLCRTTSNLSSSDNNEYRRLSLYVMFIHISYALYIFVIIGDMIHSDKFQPGLVKTACVVLLEIWIAVPMLQFLCWTLLFKFLYGKSIGLLLETAAIRPAQPFMLVASTWRSTTLIQQIVVTQPHRHRTIKQLRNTLKHLMTLKSSIVRIYGLTLILFLWNCCGSLVFSWIVLLQEMGKIIGVFLVLRVIFLVTGLFGVFWASESTSYCVSRTQSQLNHPHIAFPFSFSFLRITISMVLKLFELSMCFRSEDRSS